MHTKPASVPGTMYAVKRTAGASLPARSRSLPDLSRRPWAPLPPRRAICTMFTYVAFLVGPSPPLAGRALTSSGREAPACVVL